MKIDYQPVTKRKYNEIAFVVSKGHLNTVNNSIHNKIERNKEKRVQSSKRAKDYHVGINFSNVSSSKYLVKISNLAYIKIL